ncbi:MAG: hypothetical protein RIC55_21490 [Pirellulaceae bacterium]
MTDPLQAYLDHQQQAITGLLQMSVAIQNVLIRKGVATVKEFEDEYARLLAANDQRLAEMKRRSDKE